MTWHMSGKQELQYFVTFGYWRKPRWKTKKFGFALILRANISKIWHFFTSNGISSIEMADCQLEYSLSF